MKSTLKYVAICLLFVLSSCSSVRVVSDFESGTNFSDYKTFAFFKTGIDKAEINDIDKRRILRAIEAELIAKGMTKSSNPDVLVSIFTKSNEQVNVRPNMFNGFGFGFGGFGFGGFGYPFIGFNGGFGNSISVQTQGQLFIDVIDAEKKELVWQGKGTGYLTKNQEKKEARIKEFVSKIIAEYPPNQ